MGIIVNEDKAYNPRVPCHGFVIDPDKTLDEVLEEMYETGEIPAEDVLLFKEGVIGALNNEQDRELCNISNTFIMPTPIKLKRRLQYLKKAMSKKF